MPRPRFLKCCVPGCPSREDKPPCPKFHYVPLHNLKRRRIWLKLMKISSKTFTKTKFFICQKHFERVFITKENKLTRFAYPTLFTQEEIEEGHSKKYPISQLFGLAAVDHSYCRRPPNTDDHSYNVPVPQTLEGILTGDSDKEDAENNSEDKQKEDNNSEHKDEVDNNLEEKAKEKKTKKKNVKPPLGSAKRPIYFIHKNKIKNDSPNTVLCNNNLKDNDNNVSLAENSDGKNSSKLHKLLVDNKIINDNANDNVVTDDCAVDYDNDDNVFDPNMLIDLTEDPTNNIDNNVSADDNPLDNIKPAHDYLAVDHTEVISEITNEEILEQVITELNKVKTSLSDMKLTEKLDTKDLALINYNNTVVLCRKSEVAEFKNNYPDLENKDRTDQEKTDQTDQDPVVIKAKRRRKLRQYGRKIKLEKQGKNEEQNADNEDQEAVKHILCACDVNSPCEHRNTAPIDLTFCNDCDEEHPVDYNCCRENDPKHSPEEAPINKKKDNHRRYVTVEKFEEVNNDIHKLMQTTQQIQGQINNLTTVLTSLVNAVGKIEKEREQQLIKKFQQAAKPRPPRKPKPKEPKKSKSEEAVSIMESLLGLPVEESLHEEETLPEQESLHEQETLPEPESLHEQGTLPEQESLHVNEYLPVHRHLPVNNEYLTVNRSLLGKRRLPVQETLPVPENLPEDEYEPAHRHLPVNNEYLPLSRRLPKKRRLPVQETLPVHGTLSTHEYLPANKRLTVQEISPVDEYLAENKRSCGGKWLPEQETSPADECLPGNKRPQGGKWLPVQQTVPVDDNLPGNRRVRGGKRLPVLYQEETIPGTRHSRGGKWLPVQETLPVDDNLPENRRFRGGKYLPVNYQEENLPENRRFRGGKRLPVQETAPTHGYSPVNRSLPML